MDTLRTLALDQMIPAAQEGGPAIICRLDDGLGLKMVRRRERLMLAAWRVDGRPIKASDAEEIGEDAGFYDPRFKAWQCAESEQALLITEGFTGDLCAHVWAVNMHFDARLEFGNIYRCGACGVTLTRTLARRGSSDVCSYDNWDVRLHIFGRWAKRGPVPGSLVAQPYHEPTAKPKRAKAAR